MIDVIASAITVALVGLCTAGLVYGVARALRPVTPVTLADPWRIDTDWAIEALQAQLERHPVRRRAEVIVSGVPVTIHHVVRVGDDSAWPAWLVRVGEHQMESATFEGALDIARYRLDAIREARAERALVAK